MFYFISGGVRSGKSTFAEKLALSHSEATGIVHYVATSIVYDEEMNKRVKRHQEMRKSHPACFITHERPVHIEGIIEQFEKGDVVLIDCLTTLLSNELFSGWEKGEENWKEKEKRTEICKRLINTFRVLQKNEVVVILVSNELVNDRLPKDESTFYYLQMLGALHQKIVSFSDYAILVESSIPIYKKGVNERERNYVSRNIV